MSDQRNLVLKGRKYWCQAAVPKALRAVVGKNNLLANLNTGDLVVAQRKRRFAMADFQRVFEDARTGKLRLPTTTTLKDEAAWWRDQLAESKAADPEGIMSSFLADRCEDIERSRGADAAQRFYKIASGAHIPLLQYLRQYLKECGVAPNTIIERRAAISRFGTWAGDLDLREVTRRVAGCYRSEVLAEMHPNTANKHVQALRSYWKWIADRGHIDDDERNPWARQRFKKPRKRADEGERPFTDDEIVRILSGPAATHMHYAMRIAALSGLRIEEMTDLKVSSILPGGFYVPVSKNGDARTVPVHPELQPLVAELTHGKPHDAYLLNGLDGAVDRAAALSKRFTTYRRALGIGKNAPGHRRADVNFHSFRRWFSTKADHAGIHERVIEATIGHKSGSVLHQSYARAAAVRHVKECVEAVQLPTGAATIRKLM